MDRRFWTSFRSRFPATGPRERAFHSATVIGNYMVVYGEPSLQLQSTCSPPSVCSCFLPALCSQVATCTSTTKKKSATMKRYSSTTWVATSGCLPGSDGPPVSSSLCSSRQNSIPLVRRLQAFLSLPLSGGDAVRGRYSHVAAAMEGRVLLVAGGYSGVARGDLVAYKVPLFVSSDQGDRVSA